MTGIPQTGGPAFPDPWIRLQRLTREEPARRFLEAAYERANVPSPKRSAYRNAESLAALIRQAESVFRPPVPHSPWLEPMLAYYGSMSLLKAWILSVHPEYPESTAVLRHGLSTRKKKKEPFHLFEDEVKVRKEGLVPLLAAMTNATDCIGETYKFGELAASLADMVSIHRAITGKSPLVPLKFAPFPSGSKAEHRTLILLPEPVLDSLKLTPAALARKVARITGWELTVADPPVKDGTVRFVRTLKGDAGTGNMDGSLSVLRENERGDHYLWIGNDRPVTPVPELLSRFMLLFSLCMLCRYDPPLWGEIALGTVREEGVWVRRFLDLTALRIPRLVLAKLEEAADWREPAEFPAGD
ncbi:YaaC family protein [Staphylospora marina]|uniref:YaaC family protein n=1 Tax=Staphylospora marina TaxID=2490858 RepID=UPI0019CF8D0D|nr:YaaC family protein [Staphylospora marina]